MGTSGKNSKKRDGQTGEKALERNLFIIRLRAFNEAKEFTFLA
jgi:hypothetical protein